MLRRRFGDVSPSDARALVEGGALLLDVRTPGEYSSGHLPNAVNVPLGELGAKEAGLAPKDRPIVVYCASGVRSAAAESLLRRAGYAKVKNLGAMSRW
ncbi:MAG: rhodanese-like domain-containing protein [Myxococcales bacterium]|nr:rhodanese-like domain-containing protein [Myxococcales bacterium]